MTLVRRVREARRKAAETDTLVDQRVEEAREVYNEVFRTLQRTRDTIRANELQRREATSGN